MKKTETFNISGMSCGHCVGAVERELKALPVEVETVEIGRAVVSYDPDEVPRAKIAEAIDEAGFDLVEA